MKWSKGAGTNVARLGIGLYGFDTSHNGHAALRPVLQMRSFITSLRNIPAGDCVGYNATYKVTRPSVIATVPVGYFEGIDRGLSSIGSMLVRGLRAPLAGRTSMNMSSLDVTDIPGVTRGDTVIAISRTASDQNSVEQMARLSGTTPYVILVHIPQHLKRVVE
jgi:alanine racemase